MLRTLTSCRLPLATAGLALLPVFPLAAQTEAAGAIRVIATFDPAADVTTFELAEPLHGRELLAIQHALASAGFPPGALDGRIGESMRSALSAFQRDRGLRSCGCPTYETALALGLTPRVTQTIVGRGGRRPERSVEVVLPAGVPPEGSAGSAAAGEGTSASAADMTAGETGFATTPTWPGAAAPGLFIPIFPFHAPFVERMAPQPAEPAGGAPLGGARGRGLGTSPRVRPVPSPPGARPSPPPPGVRPVPPARRPPSETDAPSR